MSFATIAAAGQVFAESNMGETFAIANSNYAGVVNLIETDPILELQGIRQKRQGIIVANKTQFASEPTKRTNLVYSSVTYSIRDVTNDTQAYTLSIEQLT